MKVQTNSERALRFTKNGTGLLQIRRSEKPLLYFRTGLLGSKIRKSYSRFKPANKPLRSCNPGIAVNYGLLYQCTVVCVPAVDERITILFVGYSAQVYEICL